MSMPMASSSNHTMNMDQAALHMTFFWGKDVIVLFDGWPGNQVGMYISALAFVFLIAFLVELLSGSTTLKVVVKKRFLGALIHAGVYAVRVSLGYLVMLSVMSLNIGVFIAAVAGHVVGYFIVKFQEISEASRSATASEDILTIPKV